MKASLTLDTTTAPRSGATTQGDSDGMEDDMLTYCGMPVKAVSEAEILAAIGLGARLVYGEGRLAFYQLGNAVYVVDDATAAAIAASLPLPPPPK